MHQLNILGASQREEVRAILRRAQAKNLKGARFMRGRNTDRLGRPFTGLQKAIVWLNATVIPGKDIALWRQDKCGAHMYWHDYGKSDSTYGWEVDHILPIRIGGTDDTTNLQALHWQNNRSKGDRTDGNYCVVNGIDH